MAIPVLPQLSLLRNFFKKLLKLYLRYVPIRKGKKLIMNSLSPLIVGQGYQEIAYFDRGLRMLLDLDDWIQRQIYYFGYYFMEREETKIFQNLLRPGDIFMDIGANVGVYTLQAASRVEPSGHVYAFEPIDANFRRLNYNVQMNRLKNVTLNRLALSDASGTLRLFVGDHSNTGTSSISRSGNWSGLFEEVETTTVDEFITNNSIQDVRLVKIDVEGSELKVIQGMKEFISADNPPYLLVEIDSRRLESAGTSSKELVAFLTELKYEPFLITKSGLKPVSFVSDAHLVLFRHQSRVGES